MAPQVRLVFSDSIPTTIVVCDVETDEPLIYPYRKQSRILFRDGICYLALECELPEVITAQLHMTTRQSFTVDPEDPASIELAIRELKRVKAALPQQEGV